MAVLTRREVDDGVRATLRFPSRVDFFPFFRSWFYPHSELFKILSWWTSLSFSFGKGGGVSIISEWPSYIRIVIDILFLLKMNRSSFSTLTHPSWKWCKWQLEGRRISPWTGCFCRGGPDRDKVPPRREPTPERRKIVVNYFPRRRTNLEYRQHRWLSSSSKTFHNKIKTENYSNIFFHKNWKLKIDDSGSYLTKIIRFCHPPSIINEINFINVSVPSINRYHPDQRTALIDGKFAVKRGRVFWHKQEPPPIDYVATQTHRSITVRCTSNGLKMWALAFNATYMELATEKPVTFRCENMPFGDGICRKLGRVPTKEHSAPQGIRK